jgi:hypothetical protein
VNNAVNADLRIAFNQIRDNGGTNLAGGIGLFAGTRGYQVDHNDLCGNFSAEYGGALTHFGLSEPASSHAPNDISNNRIWFNQSYDEGGAVMVAGELVNNLTDPSPGSGRVDIHENLIADNLANDDGGGIRMLQAGTFAINVANNMIANNISAHEGGGIALDDSTNVRVVNNTIYRNLTTATAITSDGTPAPAGLSTAPNSVQLQATLPATAPKFSDPLLFNNVFRDNRAGSWNGAYITGIGSPDAPVGDAINRWDMGVADGPGQLSPTNSVLHVTTGTVLSATNKVGVDPAFVNTSNDINVTVAPLRAFPSFRLATIVIQNVPVGLLGNYHIQAGSPATNMGAAAKTGVTAPAIDIDGQGRPNPAGSSVDAGADEIANGSAVAAAARAAAPAPPRNARGRGRTR